MGDETWGRDREGTWHRCVRWPAYWHAETECGQRDVYCLRMAAGNSQGPAKDLTGDAQPVVCPACVRRRA